MTTTEDRSSLTASGATHPLSRMTATEIDTARTLVADARFVQPSTVLVNVGLEEPHKREVHDTPGSPVERRMQLLGLDRATGAGCDVLVPVNTGSETPTLTASPTGTCHCAEKG